MQGFHRRVRPEGCANPGEEHKLSLKTGPAFTRRALIVSAAVLLCEGGAEAGSLPQKAVSYQDKPNDGHMCSQCTFFQPPNACKSVAGEISPNGWCKLFHAKES